MKLFEHVVPILVNQEHRRDRYLESVEEFRKLAGWDIAEQDVDRVHIIRPEKFESASGFINPSYRSCLHAHLEAARWAYIKGVEITAIFEDDFLFDEEWSVLESSILSDLLEREWDAATLGYISCSVDLGDDKPYCWKQFSGETIGSHAYLLNRKFLPTWIDHLEKISKGKVGDSLQGPMGPDAALNTITWIEPETKRYILNRSMVNQRSSRSDCNPSWIDRFPFSFVSGIARKVVRL